MKAFIDTSSLIKRYVTEGDYAALDGFLEDVSQIIISPVTWLEIQSVLERRLRDKSLSQKETVLIEKNVEKDLDYFGMVQWGASLEEMSKYLIRKYQLKVL